MKRGFVTIFVIVAIVIVVGILIVVNSVRKVDSEIGENNVKVGSKNIEPQTFTVLITDEGYSPQTLNIDVGNKVIWRHEGAQQNWPASASHPTHKVYPNSGIEKCGTEDEDIIFDACHGLVNGDEWSFTFDEAGSWNYHDHLHPNLWGKIIVK